jgi:hypothetical protein
VKVQLQRADLTAASPRSKPAPQARGQRLRVAELWHCIEEEFSTTRGGREVLPLLGGAGPGALLN